MKTIQKVLTMSIATLFTSVAFGQFNLGVHSTTNAAVNAAINPGVVVQSTQAVTNAARGSASLVVGKTMDLKSTASGAVNGATDTKVNAGVKAKAGAKQNSGVDASESQNAGVQANGSTDIGTVKESTSISRIKGDADVSVKAKSETRATVGGQ